VFWRELSERAAETLDRKRGWHSLRPWLGSATLYLLRQRLRSRNLYDNAAADPPKPRARRVARTVDGTQTDLGDPGMGAAGTRFGRNAPLVAQDDRPDASVVSERLLERRSFLPAASLNLLAAAWIQFEVHDWMQHRLDGDRMAREPGSPAAAPRFLSDQTHWWDASQLYGADPQFAAAIRAGDGRVKEDGALLRAIEPFVARRPAPVPNLWLGLALFHVLFAREHNAICAALEREEGLRGDALFDKGRLVNAALMAKIHTVEWTPAVIAHPVTLHASDAIWWGALRRELPRRFGEIGSGIPGSKTHHDGVRYSLTEEFVAVYRMHPLIPDEVRFRRVADDAPVDEHPFGELAVGAGPVARPRTRLYEIGQANALYSLGIANPGAIALRNFPEFLRALPLPDGTSLDLAARDIERTREARIPRFNDFRRAFRLPPATSFLEVAGCDEQLAREIRDVYEGDLEAVDLIVGLFGERKPPGFAFSDTAFRVFLLMAARRLRSDRFFTNDFTEAVYTPTGMRWIREGTLKGMLARHHPELGPVLPDGNVFSPWRWA
jgi:Animal haem peroxidase